MNSTYDRVCAAARKGGWDAEHLVFVLSEFIDGQQVDAALEAHLQAALAEDEDEEADEPSAAEPSESE